MRLANHTLQILGATVVCCLLLVAEAAAEVRVYYFHSTARCAECLKIEELTGEFLREAFPQELATGHLTWRPTNADLAENTHFVFDYDLAANELVVVREAGSHAAEVHKLPEVWNLVHDPDIFRAKLLTMVKQALAKVE